MSEWVRGNLKLIAYLFIILCLLLVAFYIYIVRPVSTEVTSKQLELLVVNQDIQSLQSTLQSIEPKELSKEEQQALLRSVPLRPNVEQIIADLEKTELETGAVIDSLQFNIIENEKNDQGGSEDANPWKQLLPEQVYTVFTEKIQPINDIVLSYVEINVALNGEAKAVHAFVHSLQKLERAIHVQSYDYSKSDEEEEERIGGTVIFRAFFSEDFAPFIEDTLSFQLGYEFDPSKINRYVPKETIQESSDQENPEGSEIAIGIEPIETTSPFVGVKPRFDLYQKTVPEEVIKDGELVFFAVQTGAYTSDYYLYRALQNLMNAGYAPRVRENSLSIIFTAIAATKKAALEKAEELNNMGFHSFVKPMAYHFEDPLVQEASLVVAAMTNGAVLEAAEKIKAYETKVSSIMDNASSSRKAVLEDTIYLLKEAELLLHQYETMKNPAVLREMEGLLLDFVFLLKGDVKVIANK